MKKKAKAEFLINYLKVQKYFGQKCEAPKTYMPTISFGKKHQGQKR